MFQVLASMVLGTKNAYPIIKLGLLVRALRPHCPVLQATLGARYSPRGNEVGEDYLFCSFTKKLMPSLFVYYCDGKKWRDECFAGTWVVSKQKLDVIAVAVCIVAESECGKVSRTTKAAP